MGYPDWEDDRMNSRHRTGSVTDWSVHPGYPRPGQHQVPPTSRRAAASSWDLSSSTNHFPPPGMMPNRGGAGGAPSMQQAQSMAHLNWRPGMWPTAAGAPPEFGGNGWDYPGNPNPFFSSHFGVVDGPMMKRTPSNLSMSAMPDGPMMCWPMMYPGGFHPSMMWGSQSQLGGPMMMMMNPGAHQQGVRPPSPASSQRSRRSSVQKSSA